VTVEVRHREVGVRVAVEIACGDVDVVGRHAGVEQAALAEDRAVCSAVERGVGLHVQTVRDGDVEPVVVVQIDQDGRVGREAVGVVLGRERRARSGRCPQEEPEHVRADAERRREVTPAIPGQVTETTEVGSGEVSRTDGAANVPSPRPSSSVSAPAAAPPGPKEATAIC
jgi:hypothetical protein